MGNRLYDLVKANMNKDRDIYIELDNSLFSLKGIKVTKDKIILVPYEEAEKNEGKKIKRHNKQLRR